MEKEFYYLDEKEQKGPFNVDQLKTVCLKPDTLVWTDGLENWKLAKDVPELANIIKKLPPPIPVLDNCAKQEFPKEKELPVIDLMNYKKSNYRRWAIVIIFFTAIMLFIAGGLLGYLYVNLKKNYLKNDISEKINTVFNGKTVIADGENDEVRGEFEKCVYKNQNPNLNGKPEWRKIHNNDSIDLNGTNLYVQSWEERERLHSSFKCSKGGFTVKRLTRRRIENLSKNTEEEYNLEIYKSTDLGFQKPINYKSKSAIQSYYNNIFDKFLHYYEKESYIPGKYNDITNFPNIKNDYYYIDINPSWDPHREIALPDHSVSESINDAKVYYNYKHKVYTLTFDSENYKKNMFFVIKLILIIIFLLIVILGISKRNIFKNLHLFNKHWINTSHKEQILIFKHSFFGSHTFVEINNDKVLKGVVKFTGKGNTVNLSYPNKELFYKIEKINQDDLILVSIKEKISITFKRVGAKEAVENEVKVDNTINEEVKQNEQTENEETNK